MAGWREWRGGGDASSCPEHVSHSVVQVVTGRAYKDPESVTLTLLLPLELMYWESPHFGTGSDQALACRPLWLILSTSPTRNWAPHLTHKQMVAQGKEAVSPGEPS